MNYLEIKEEISIKTDRLEELNRTIASLSSDLTGKYRQKEALNAKYEKIRNDDEQRQKEIYDAKIAQPYQDVIAKLEKKRMNLKNSYSEKMSQINEDKYRKKYEKRVNPSSTDKIYKEIESHTKKFYGEDLTDLLTAIVPDEVSTTVDVKKLLPKLRDTAAKLEGSKDYLSIIENSFDNVDLQKDDQKSMFMALGIAALFIGLVVFAYPLFLISLIIVFVYNIYRSYVFVQCTSLLKSYTVHSDEIANLVDQMTKDAVQCNRDLLTQKYESIIKKINNEIVTCENEMNNELINQGNNFVYKSDKIDNELRSSVDVIERSIVDLNTSLLDCKSEKEEVSTRLAELRNMLDTSLSNLTNEYLPKEPNISNKHLPRDYLFDIDGNTPIIFDVPKSSTIFIYDELDVSLNLQELMFLQTITRVCPKLLSYYIFDSKSLCRNFSSYEGDYDWLTTFKGVDDFREYIQVLNNSMMERRKFMAESGNIFQYNDSMIEMDCQPEPYVFVYIQDPPKGVLEDQRFMQLLENGATYGYFIYLFVNNHFIEDNKDSELLKCCDQIYKVSDDFIQKQSKDAVLMDIAD